MTTQRLTAEGNAQRLTAEGIRESFGVQDVSEVNASAVGDDGGVPGQHLQNKPGGPRSVELVTPITNAADSGPAARMTNEGPSMQKRPDTAPSLPSTVADSNTQRFYC